VKVSHKDNREMKKVYYRPAKKGDVTCNLCGNRDYYHGKECCTDDEHYYLFLLRDSDKYTCGRGINENIGKKNQ